MLEHKGHRAHRCDDKNNLLERIFAEEWASLNQGSRCTLEYMLADEVNKPRGEVSQRDATVAATVIQWLGTDVGQCFLRTVLEKKER
jgi:hypothetical protein